MAKLLFVCSMNKWRSPTAEKIYCKDALHQVRSAGTSSKAKKTISIKDIQWAEQIFVMESKHKQRLQADFRQELQYKKIHILDIPDDYQFMDPELISLLQDSIDPLLANV